MTLLNVRTGGLLLLLMVFLCSCESTTPQHSEVFILIDQTGSFIQEDVNAEKTVDFIISKTQTDLSQLTKNSFDLTIYPLTDLEHNKRIQLQLPKGQGMMNEIKKKRLEAQQAFRGNIVAGINMMKSDTDIKYGSQLVKPLCERLHLLGRKTADRKLVVLFSDLFEYNKHASFYKGSIEQIKKKLDKQCDCGDLTGIEVYCIYQTDSETDEQFGVVRKAFQAFIEDANGSFSYLPNL